MNASFSSFLSKIPRQSQTQLNPDWFIADQIYIYGTGKAGKKVWRALTNRRLIISGYMDHRTGENYFIEGVPIFRPDSPTITSRDQTAIVLAIHNREVDMPALIGWLQSLGYVNFISMIDLYDYFDTQLGSWYWLTRRTFYTDHEHEIDATARLFADQSSRSLLDSIMRFRLTGNYAFLPMPDLEHQYFPADLTSWSNQLRFVDCGAYNGDTLASFLRAGYEFQAVAAFEPDHDNFRKLSSYVSQNQERFPNSSLFPCGVYSSTTQLTFETGAGEATKASKKGTAVVQCISLDESIPTFAPDLIKMDIEGGEMDAILGAKQLIKTYHPALAISAYHYPAHIWEIPLYINQIAQEYNIQYTYYLRAHAHNGFDTVFYAIPER